MKQENSYSQSSWAEFIQNADRKREHKEIPQLLAHLMKMVSKEKADRGAENETPLHNEQKLPVQMKVVM